MLIEYFKTSSVFNATKYQENEANRWKFIEEMDPACDDGFFIRSPKPILFLTTSYILFVCLIGPFLMRSREPFQLKTLIRLYNLFMVFLAGLLFYQLHGSIGAFGALMDCNKTFSFNDDSGTQTYQLANFIIMVRLSEYLDTIFFTLRKKQNQVTFLHVFHHAFVPMYAYWILRTAPLRFNLFIIVVNSFIHVLMYSYYFLATFQEPRGAPGTSASPTKPTKQGTVMYIVTKLLMFKKYMTQLQILQFVSLAAYALWAMVQPNHCQVPWTYIIANLLLAFGFLSLFLHFYMRAYKIESAAKKAASKRA